MKITVELTDGMEGTTTIGTFVSIEAADKWIQYKKKEKKYSIEDLEDVFKAARIPTLNRKPFDAIRDFHYMTFEQYMR